MVRDDRRDIIILLGLTVAGAALRFYNIGALSLWGNEDYLAISVRAILEHGTPRFPSDVIYTRALPFTYIAAASVKLFGNSEFALRLPSAICSTLVIPFIYIFARQVIGRATGLIASALVAVFFWEILASHTARMYAMFSLTILATLIAIHAAEINGRRWLRAVALGLIVLTAFLHKISIALIFMLLAYVPYFLSRGRKPWVIILYLLVLIVAILANRAIESTPYQQWNELAAHKVVAQSQASTSVDKLEQLGQAAAPLFYRFAESHPTGNVVFLAGAAIIACGLLFGCVVSLRQWLLYSALAAMVLALTFQQVIIASLIWMTFLAANAWLRSDNYFREAIISAMLLAGAAALWTGFGFATGDELSLSGMRGAIKQTIAYPPLFLRIFLETYPWLSAIFLAASFWIAVCAVRAREYSGAIMVFFVFILPLLAMGLHPLALGRLYDRYMFFLGPYFLIIVAFGIHETFRVANHWWHGRKMFAAIALASCMVFALVLSGGASLSRSIALVKSAYGENHAIYDRWTGKYYFHPDYQGPSHYVASNYREGDVVIAMDILAHYAYFPHADYQLTVSGKRDAEGWIAARTIDSAEQLKFILDDNKQHRIWIITAAIHLRESSNKQEVREIVKAISEHSGKARYVGRDGSSSVYCAGCDTTH